MKVILLENIDSLGKKGEVKEVSDGYATNFLIPNNKVALATKEAVDILQAKDKKKVEQQQEKIDEYTKIRQTLAKQSLVFTAKVSDKDNLFKNIQTRDIIDRVQSRFHLSLNAKWFKHPVTIKTVGKHELSLTLPTKEIIKFYVNIKADG